MREKTHTTNTHTQTFKSSSCFQFSAHKHHRSVHNHTNSDVDVVKPNTNLMSAALPRTVRCSHTCICCLYLFINSLRRISECMSYRCSFVCSNTAVVALESLRRIFSTLKTTEQGEPLMTFCDEKISIY